MYRCMGCMNEYDGSTDVCPHCGYVRGTAAREAYHLAPESILEGRYIVGRVLGFGGFGVTYIGWDAQLDRVVAIKEFLPTTFATRMPGGTAVTVYEGAATEQFGFGLDRFVQEAQRLAQFNGIPGVTDIYDTFGGNNTAYIVMQFLKGHDVKDVLAAEGPMPYEKARDIILKVCDTLAPVHAKGIIHRDISPDNIFLTDDGEVKLLDFGAARYESSVNSKSLSVILKAGYAPEEQYRSKGDQGPWTDVYALAATFYKMLTGVTPPDSMERAIKDELKEPSKMGSDIPQSAENALLNALNIRKADRTQTVEDFKQALLSDGVERVKVKQRKADTGRVPTWAKVLIGGAVAVLLVFAILTTTGVIEVQQGGILQDDFGTAVDSGNAMVPGLAGKTEAEAKKLLEEAGLVMETGAAEFSESAAKGIITTQDPMPGRQIAVGGTVTVGISAGSLESAMADGSIPNLVGMGAVESAGYLTNLAGDFYPRYKYEYSDTVPEGTVLSFKRNPGEGRVMVTLSAGPDNGTPIYGTARAPVMYAHYDLQTSIAAASSRWYEEGTTYNEYTHWEYQISADGGSWQTVYDNHQTAYSAHEEMDKVPADHAYLYERLIYQYQTLGGKELRLRVNQYSGNYETRDETLLDTIDFEQRIQYELVESPIRVDTAKVLTHEEVLAMVEDGTLDGERYPVNGYLESDAEERERNPLVYFTGNFEESKNYYFIWPQAQGYYHSSAPRAGEIVAQVYNYKGYNQFSFGVVLEPEFSISEDGMVLTFSMTSPAEITAESADGLPAIMGATPDEAARALQDVMAGDGYLRSSFQYNEMIPSGQVIGLEGEKDDAGKYAYANLIISVGQDDGLPRVVPGPGRNYNTAWAWPDIAIIPGEQPEEAVEVEIQYSGDGGATWQTSFQNHYGSGTGIYEEVAYFDGSEEATQLVWRATIRSIGTGDVLFEEEFAAVPSGEVVLLK